MADEPTVFRPDSVSYLRIPAPDPAEAAAFYGAVFGWEVDPEGGRFTDGSGHVIGHFVTDSDIAGEDGVRPYIYVENVEQTLAKLNSLGGSAATPPYPEGNLKVADLPRPSRQRRWDLAANRTLTQPKRNLLRTQSQATSTHQGAANSGRSCVCRVGVGGVCSRRR